jgi:hypothetical protein
MFVVGDRFDETTDWASSLKTPAAQKRNVKIMVEISD